MNAFKVWMTGANETLGENLLGKSQSNISRKFDKMALFCLRNAENEVT